jgi:branched-chain amino acid transport system substrate-binding protein
MAVAAVVCVGLLTGFTSGKRASTVYIAMDAPLTGPTSFVGLGDRESILALVRYWNAHGGIKGRQVQVDIADNASNPTQAVQNVQKFAADPKYVAILGSGNAAAAIASAGIATQAKIPFIALSPPLGLVSPPREYVYIANATSRLYAYPFAQYLRAHKLTRVALIGDNGGYGREATGQAASLARAYGYTVTDTITFSPAQTDFTADLTKVKNSNAQALLVFTAQAGGITIAKQAKQLNLPQKLFFSGASISPQFLQGACPEMNGQMVDGTLGTAYTYLPKSNPVRKQAELVAKVLGHPLSNFDADGSTAILTFKAAMERGGFTREGINRAIETKLRGLPTPHGKLFYSPRNHSPIQLSSMWVGTFVGCKPKPQTGAAFTKTKKKK